MKKRVPKELKEYFRSMGKAGGKSRMADLTEDERKELARKAGKASGAARKKGKK